MAIVPQRRSTFQSAAEAWPVPISLEAALDGQDGECDGCGRPDALDAAWLCGRCQFEEILKGVEADG